MCIFDSAYSKKRATVVQGVHVARYVFSFFQSNGPEDSTILPESRWRGTIPDELN